MVALNSRFVLALSPKSCGLLLSRCTPVPLPVRTVLYESGQLPKYAFFLTSGIASVVTDLSDGGTAEVEIIGHEGLVGSFHLLGSAPVSTRCFMQISGTGLRVELADLRAMFQSSGETRGRILELVQQQALSISQLSSCNGHHKAEARLARWLLMVQDRTQSETLPLTQLFLSEMLGTQRTTVTSMAGALQRAGIIRYRQGEVTVVDRKALEAAACDCYRVIQKLYFGLYSEQSG